MITEDEVMNIHIPDEENIKRITIEGWGQDGVPKRSIAIDTNIGDVWLTPKKGTHKWNVIQQSVLRCQYCGKEVDPEETTTIQTIHGGVRICDDCFNKMIGMNYDEIIEKVREKKHG